MSCYNWCSGTIKIPTKEWSAFRKAVIAATTATTSVLSK